MAIFSRFKSFFYEKTFAFYLATSLPRYLATSLPRYLATSLFLMMLLSCGKDSALKQFVPAESVGQNANTVKSDNSMKTMTDNFENGEVCDVPESECGECRWRFICASSSHEITEWWIMFSEGVMGMTVSGGQEVCTPLPYQILNNITITPGVWYPLDCIAHSSSCGGFFVKGELYTTGYCFPPGQILIELDCGNGVKKLKLANSIESVCCEQTSSCTDEVFPIAYFRVEDDCSITSDDVWYPQPNGLPPCYTGDVPGNN